MPFEPWNNCMKKKISSICNKIINLKVLRNTLFKMLIPVCFPGIKGCVQIVIFTPPHAKYPQISDEDSTFFLFIIGSSQLISKILLAFFVYCNFISKHTILSIALLLTSVSCMFISFYTNFVTMTILSWVVWKFPLWSLSGDTCGICWLSNLLMHGLGLSISNPILGRHILISFQTSFINIKDGFRDLYLFF